MLSPKKKKNNTLHIFKMKVSIILVVLALFAVALAETQIHSKAACAAHCKDAPHKYNEETKECVCEPVEEKDEEVEEEETPVENVSKKSSTHKKSTHPAPPKSSTHKTSTQHKSSKSSSGSKSSKSSGASSKDHKSSASVIAPAFATLAGVAALVAAF